MKAALRLHIPQVLRCGWTPRWVPCHLAQFWTGGVDGAGGCSDPGKVPARHLGCLAGVNTCLLTPLSTSFRQASSYLSLSRSVG